MISYSDHFTFRKYPTDIEWLYTWQFNTRMGDSPITLTISVHRRLAQELAGVIDLAFPVRDHLKERNNGQGK